MRTSQKSVVVQRFEEHAFLDALLRGEYDRCRALIAGDTSARAALAASRVALREGRYVDVVGILSAFSGSDSEATERDVLLGASLGMTKDFARGAKLLEKARSRITFGMPLRDDAYYFSALVAWMEHDHRGTEQFIAPIFESQDPNQRARAYTLRSWIAARRKDLHAQVGDLQRALDELESAPQADEFYRAGTLSSLAVLCRELPMPEVAERVRTTYRSVLWSSGLQQQYFQITRLLAWVDEMAGNELAAFRGFKSAANAAPSDFWQVLCLLDRSRLAKETGEHAFAIDQLQEAHEIASKLPWGESIDEERCALLILAELFSDVDPALAHQYLARFRTLNSSVIPVLSYGTDPRVRAFEAFSSGVAHLRLEERDEAQRLLLEAWTIFEDFGYGWRSALCAMHLADATGEAAWHERAQTRIAPWPNSWIARQIERGKASSQELPAVPPAQAQVLELLLSGKRNAEIAQALGRSPNTIRNQVAELFKHFGVNTRSQLVATVLQK